MRRAQVVVVMALLLGACERGPQGTASSASAPEAGATPPKTGDGPEAPSERSDGGEDGAAAAAEDAEPHRRAGDPAAGVDELVVWGWSPDGRYFAFETYHHGADMVSCEGEAELTVVDVPANATAADGHVLVKHAEPEAEVCDPPDLRAALAERRGPLLERFGITAAGLGEPVSFEAQGERWSFSGPGREPVALSFTVLHGVEDPFEAIDGAAFELRATPPGKDEVVLEDGRERRAWTLGYELERGLVFTSPQGEHAALLVATRSTMPEGVRTSWIARGLAL